MNSKLVFPSLYPNLSTRNWMKSLKNYENKPRNLMNRNNLLVLFLMLLTSFASYSAEDTHKISGKIAVIPASAMLFKELEELALKKGDDSQERRDATCLKPSENSNTSPYDLTVAFNFSSPDCPDWMARCKADSPKIPLLTNRELVFYNWGPLKIQTKDQITENNAIKSEVNILNIFPKDILNIIGQYVAEKCGEYNYVRYWECTNGDIIQVWLPTSMPDAGGIWECQIAQFECTSPQETDFSKEIKKEILSKKSLILAEASDYMQKRYKQIFDQFEKDIT